MERYELLEQLERELYGLVPPIDPGCQYWLISDAGPSFCTHCVDLARGAEFELGMPLTASPFRETPMERAFWRGIDGGWDSNGDDGPSHCETCGCTLQYSLTEYGLEEELSHFATYPGFHVIGPEGSYTVSRICLNLTWSGAKAEQVEAAIVIVQDAIEAARAGRIEI
jgi:hypothetical protein